jgi:acyl-CoA synthetase (AMP-forming)/AMP-acid ligase II
MSFASPFPDVEVPDVGVFEYLFGGIEEADLDRVALVDAKTGQETSFRSLIAAIEAFAAALAARGIGVGDVVGLHSPNSSAFAVAFHGILRAGATATAISPLSTTDEVVRQLGDSGARLLLTVTALRERAKEAVANVGLSENDVVVLDGEGFGPPLAGRRAPEVRFDPATHVAALPYSSGTTGLPKGVMLTHRNLVANVAQIVPMQQIASDEVVMAVLPFFHVYGMTVLLNASLAARIRLVIMPAFDLAEFLAFIQEYRCTRAFIAPPVAVALAKHPMVDSHDLSSLKVIMSGAASLDAKIGRAVADRLGATVIQGYGMSELGPVSHCTPFDRGQDALGTIASLDSCGWTVPNGVSKLIDESGEEIAVPDHGLSATGELCFKGPNVMVGYLGNPRATDDTIDAEGFLHTGDLARVDADGCVYIVDRLKELIKYKGHQVAPAELEGLLLTHPGVADAAVVGVRDPATGEEIPKAFVVSQPGVGLTATEVMDFVAARVAPYEKVRAVEFVDTIPKSAAGKILRKDLRAG